VDRIELDDTAREFVRKAAKGTVRIITNPGVIAVTRWSTKLKRRKSDSTITFLQASRFFSSK
jgi:acyl CoA:acetate/3-ketoacid CoA transferase beta subunit